MYEDYEKYPNLPKLPDELSQSLEQLQSNKNMNEAFGGNVIKSYIKLGGKVGLDAYVDHEFNTTDVCLIMDISLVDQKRKSFFAKGDLT